MPNKQPA
jgi:hypothetical protein